MNKRIKWIDTLRGIGMFFVVYGHVFLTNKWKIRKFIYSFHMPLFFLISGMTFTYSENLNFKEFIKKKAKSYLLPYLIINIICLPIIYYYSKIGVFASCTIKDLIIGIFYCNADVFPLASGTTWFLLCLFLTEIVFYIIKKYFKDDREITLCLIACGIISYINWTSDFQKPGPWHIETVLTAVVFYGIGYFLMKNITIVEKVIEKLKYKKYLICLALGTIGFIIPFFNRNITMAGNRYGSIIFFYIGSLSCIFALIIIVNSILKKSKFFNSVGKYTMFYLGYHHLAVYFVKARYPNLLNSSIKCLIVSLIIFIAIYPISYLVQNHLPILIGKIDKPKNNKISNKKYKKISKNKI